MFSGETMDIQNIEIAFICWQETIALRHDVLWPGRSPEFCHLNGDEDAIHYGAKWHGTILAVASIFIDGRHARLRKLATSTDVQGQGIGSKLLVHIINDLRDKNIELFWCDARASTIGFYERFGMKVSGERFYKSHQPYFKMTMALR